MSKAKKIIIFIVLIAILVIPFGITASAITLNNPFGVAQFKYADTTGSVSYCYVGEHSASYMFSPSYYCSVEFTNSGNVPFDVVGGYFVLEWQLYTAGNTTVVNKFDEVFTTCFYQIDDTSWSNTYTDLIDFTYNCYWENAYYPGSPFSRTVYNFRAVIKNNANNCYGVGVRYCPTTSFSSNSSWYFQSCTLDYYTTSEYEAIARDNENTDKIIQNNDENTDKIIDNQNQLQENEKNEAQSSGSSGSDDVASAVPDKSAGFTEALSTFVRSMSTTDTECNLTFPALSIPEIAGLIPAANLSAEQNINFSQVVAMIPTSILEIVRALATIALIIYCFKELYSTISYVLTMRRDKGDE